MPTIAETVPGYEVLVWYGICAPKGTPPEIVDKLNAAVNAALAKPELKQRFHQLGGEVMPISPAAFGKLVADETVKWAKVVKSAGLKVGVTRPPVSRVCAQVPVNTGLRFSINAARPSL